MEGIERTLSSELKEVLKKLLNLENWGGRHVKSAFEPKRNDEIEKEKKHLDTL